MKSANLEIHAMSRTRLETSDFRILNQMQKDSRISNAELADRVGMSASACWRRVRALEESGVIESYGIRIDARACGLEFRAIVHVRLTRHNPDNMVGFIRAVERRAEVQECYATTGQADYHLLVLCRDIDAYNRFLEEFLFRLPAVDSAQTNLILRQINTAREMAFQPPTGAGG